MHNLTDQEFCGILAEIDAEAGDTDDGSVELEPGTGAPTDTSYDICAVCVRFA